MTRFFGSALNSITQNIYKHTHKYDLAITIRTLNTVGITPNKAFESALQDNNDRTAKILTLSTELDPNQAFNSALREGKHKMTKILATSPKLNHTEAFSEAINHNSYKIANSLLYKININDTSKETFKHVFGSSYNPLIENYFNKIKAAPDFKLTSNMIDNNTLFKNAASNPAALKTTFKIIKLLGERGQLEVQSDNHELSYISNFSAPNAPKSDLPPTYEDTYVKMAGEIH